MTTSRRSMTRCSATRTARPRLLIDFSCLQQEVHRGNTLKGTYILGYGPSPVECVDLIAERCEWSLMGNHDFGVVYEPTNFNLAAEQAAYWSREQFETEPDSTKGNRHWEFLSRLRVRVVFDDFLCVHGSRGRYQPL